MHRAPAEPPQNHSLSMRQLGSAELANPTREAAFYVFSPDSAQCCVPSPKMKVPTSRDQSYTVQKNLPAECGKRRPQAQGREVARG